MSNIETGGPAFPAQHFDMVDGEHGISIRDYFAAKAMQSFISVAKHGTEFGENHQATNLNFAYASFSMADAMLKARK